MIELDIYIYTVDICNRHTDIQSHAVGDVGTTETLEMTGKAKAIVSGSVLLPEPKPNYQYFAMFNMTPILPLP